MVEGGRRIKCFLVLREKRTVSNYNWSAGGVIIPRGSLPFAEASPNFYQRCGTCHLLKPKHEPGWTDAPVALMDPDLRSSVAQKRAGIQPRIST